VDLLLIFVVSLIVLSGLDSHMWPQHATERRLFVTKLTEAERAERGRKARERARRKMQRIREKLQQQKQEPQESRP
jgi:hypothetical protein